MTETTTMEPEETAAESRVRLLAFLLTLFSSIKIVACSLAFVSAIVASGGVDEHGGHTFYWLPQILFYTILLASSRRLRRLDRPGRTAVVSLAILSLVATILYTALDFTVGPGSRDPAMAFAIKLRLLLTGGDIWDIVFPILALDWLRKPDVERLFER